MPDCPSKALFLIYNKPLQIFIDPLFKKGSSIRMEDLSEEQLPIYNLPLNRAYIVKGGPGTGKTLMSYFRAKKIANKNVIVKTWHSWLYNEIKRFSREPSDYQYRKYKYNWDLVFKLFEEVVFSNNDYTYKGYHLFLDEAQDFPKELLQILSKCFKKVTIFIDEHQAIEIARTTKVHEIRQIFDIESNPFPLSKNYRNTPEIFAVARLFFTGDQGLLPEECHIKSTGQKPRILSSYSFHDTIDFLANYNNSFPQKIVGVVLPTLNVRAKYFQALKEKRPIINVQEYISDDMNPIFTLDDTGLKLLSINTVKGLEFDTVFICDVDHSSYRNISIENDVGKKYYNRIYVSCSRAKTELIFTCENYNTNSFILDVLKTNEELVAISDDKIVVDDEEIPF